jgi:hypothetical protein
MRPLAHPDLGSDGSTIAGLSNISVHSETSMPKLLSWGTSLPLILGK